jgi:hypothetical protein
MINKKQEKMTDCIRKGDFEIEEKHQCFVIGCDSYVLPLHSETCPKCNFKYCLKGHCGCSVSEETRYALSVLYDTYCKLCSDKGTVVLWKLDGVEIEHKPIRTPKLAWNTLTCLEKFVDSAKTALHIQEKKHKQGKEFNLKTVYLSLNKSLAMLRKKISLEKKISPQTLLKVCEYRETKRTRCKNYPTRYDETTGLYLCQKHHTSWM